MSNTISDVCAKCNRVHNDKWRPRHMFKPKAFPLVMPAVPLCDTPDGKCINSGACNAADKCIQPRKE